MPIYEYRCEACGEQMELLVRDSQPPKCESCGSPRLARQLSLPVAHVASGGRPAREPDFGGCGRPQCGSGGCAGLGM